MTAFIKKLSSNDVGATGTNQSGVLVPKSDARNGIFPDLDTTVKNPDAELDCIDDRGQDHKLRFVYYNNKNFEPKGTRDEYRITCITDFLNGRRAEEGDILELKKAPIPDKYIITLSREKLDSYEFDKTEIPESEEQDTITKYHITNYPADMTISGYLDKHNNGQLVIPDFQRNYVWDQVKASKLIESFLLGLPVPGVFLYKDRRTNKLLIIDGQQRITSAINFIKGNFGDRKFRLRGVHERWENKSYDELDDPDRFQISDTVLRATIIQQLDPQDDSSIYYIFERLNTGGVNLNAMEVRRCVYYGDFFRLLEKMNEFDSWRKIIGSKSPDNRMRDVELLLRCIALYRRSEEYEKPMKGFLNKFTIEMKNMEPEQSNILFSEIQEVFERVCTAIESALGEKPFNVYGRLNFALLDSVFVAVAYHTDTRSLKSDYEKLLSMDEYEEACRISTSDDKVVRSRISIASSVISG